MATATDRRDKKSDSAGDASAMCVFGGRVRCHQNHGVHFGWGSHWGTFRVNPEQCRRKTLVCSQLTTLLTAKSVANVGFSPQ
jgi:hypothetical protein